MHVGCYFVLMMVDDFHRAVRTLFAAFLLVILASLPGMGEVVPVPVTKGLDHPWGLAFLPDGDALVTERTGRLRLLSVAESTLSDPISGLPVIDVGGQGGLLDVAIDPGFASNQTIFLTFAEARIGGNATAVFRAVFDKKRLVLTSGEVIFRQMPAVASEAHFGSRLVFDKMGNLFVTLGDRFSQRNDAQNPANHIGKVVRITRDGTPAPGNPAQAGWAAEVWSIGHRNVQGATLHPETGALWTVEHGARGGDEINRPEAGKNYGWPIITYGRDYSGAKIGVGTKNAGMEQPVHYWDPSIAPSGMAFYTGDRYPDWKGNLFVGALAGRHVARLVIADGRIIDEEKLFEGAAQFRDVVQGPDGYLYLLTDESNGSVLRIEPEGGLTATPQ